VALAVTLCGRRSLDTSLWSTWMCQDLQRDLRSDSPSSADQRPETLLTSAPVPLVIPPRRRAHLPACHEACHAVIAFPWQQCLCILRCSPGQTPYPNVSRTLASNREHRRLFPNHRQDMHDVVIDHDVSHTFNTSLVRNLSALRILARDVTAGWVYYCCTAWESTVHSMPCNR
jgi:hypothetical protein